MADLVQASTVRGAFLMQQPGHLGTGFQMYLRGLLKLQIDHLLEELDPCLRIHKRNWYYQAATNNTRECPAGPQLIGADAIPLT